MNINVFNDCENEYLFLDAQYLFKITFIQKSSSLLNSILAKYPTNIDRLEKTWDRILKKQPITDRVSFVYLYVLNVMALELDNYMRLQLELLRDKVSLEDAKKRVLPTYKGFLEGKLNTRLSGKQSLIFLKVLKLYSDVIFKDGNDAQSITKIYRAVIEPVASKLGVASPLVYNELMACDANEFMVSRFFDVRGTYRINLFRDSKSHVVLGTVDLVEGSGSTSPRAMSVNTLVFPTTVAPIIAFNSPSEQPKAMVGLAQNLDQIDQVTEQLQEEHRISPTGDMTLEAKRELLQNAKSIVDQAQANGETSALISTLSARLSAEVDALSKDSNSPYFGMTPKDIKAGLISKFLGGSEGYNDLAMRFDSALTKGIKYINDETAHAVFAIAEFSHKALSQRACDAMLASANANRQDATKRINELISAGKPFFTIDEKALRERGFNPSFEPIARPNPAIVPLLVGAAKITGAVVLVTALIITIEMFIEHFELENERESKRNLQILLNIVVNIKEEIKSIRNLAESDFSGAKKELEDYARKIPTSKHNLALIDNNDTSNVLVQNAMVNVKDLYNKILAVAKDTSLTQPLLIQQLERIISNADLVKSSTVRDIAIETKIIEDLEERDPIDALTKGITRGIKKAGDFLRYAGYISLGLFSIWGGVKLYRSLNSEED